MIDAEFSRTLRAMGKHRDAKIVVVGGGFAGIAAVAELGKRADVVWLDPRPSFEFTPNIHELVSGVKDADALRLSRARVAKRLDVEWIAESAQRLELGAHRVHTDRDRSLDYDALILAPGSVVAGLDLPGVREHARPFATIEDAEAIARAARVRAALGRPVTITVVGGGFTGVEVLGELLRLRRRVDGLQLRIVESGPRLMKDRPKQVGRRLRQIAEKRDVELRLGTRIARVGADHIELTSGETLASDLTIWAVGRTASPLLVEAGLTRGADVLVQASLQTLAWPRVFVAGDAARLAEPAEKQALIALQLGAHAARSALRHVDGKSPRPYEGDRRYALTLPFGEETAFAMFPDGHVVESAAASVRQEELFQNKMSVLEHETGMKPRDVLAAMRRRLDLSVERLPPLRRLFDGGRLRVTW